MLNAIGETTFLQGELDQAEKIFGQVRNSPSSRASNATRHALTRASRTWNELAATRPKSQATGPSPSRSTQTAWPTRHSPVTTWTAWRRLNNLFPLPGQTWRSPLLTVQQRTMASRIEQSAKPAPPTQKPKPPPPAEATPRGAGVIPLAPQAPMPPPARALAAQTPSPCQGTSQPEPIPLNGPSPRQPGPWSMSAQDHLQLRTVMRNGRRITGDLLLLLCQRPEQAKQRPGLRWPPRFGPRKTIM